MDITKRNDELIEPELCPPGGKITNKTNEVIAIYGCKEETMKNYELFKGFDNGWFYVEKEDTSTTPDCDGFYVPADRKVKQQVLGTIDGPCAVKFIKEQEVTITQEGAIYVVDSMNSGVFKPDEFCRPSKWPTCVNWYIPNKIYSEVYTMSRE